MRITSKDLDARTAELNRITGNPDQPYYLNHDGKVISRVGCFFVSQDAGGVALERMATKEGGVRTILTRTTKKDLLKQITALIYGVAIGQTTNTGA